MGETVTAGAPLLDIEPSLDVAERISVGTQAAQRQGDIDAAQQELAKAEADLARAQALSPHVVSAADVQQAATAVAVARAREEGLQRARAAEATARTQLVSVTAPIGGVLADLTATVGALVNRGDVLARLVRSGPVWIDVSVPPDADVGERYEVITDNKPVPARLIARGRLTDVGGTRTDRLLVDLPAASLFTPGATVAVRIAHSTRRGIVLPEAALVPGVESEIVFVEREPGTFAAQPVQIATRFGGQVRLAAGLMPGERVVIRGGMALQGELVRSQLRPAG
jgi:RND family efflux transporter MFP subunit